MRKPDTLRESQAAHLAEVLDAHSDLAVCYAMKEEMRSLFDLRDPIAAEIGWKKWFAAAKESGIAPEVFEKADERPANSLLYSLSVGLYNYGNGLSSPSRSVISEGFFANREKARLSITSKLLRRTC